MPQPKHISALGVPDASTLDEDIQVVFQKCVDKLGIVPNVLSAYTLRQNKLRNFMATYNELMLAPSGLSKLEREMVAVVVSSVNHCYYCLVAHGQAVRQLSGDPQLGEMMVMNYRVAPLDARQRAMLDFAWKLTSTPSEMVEADRDALRAVGLNNEDIFDLAETVGFFNMSNRLAIAIDMIPNAEYHAMNRPEPFHAPVQPPKVAKPANGASAFSDAKPAKAARPAKAEKPAKAGKPDKAVKPAKADKPAKAAKPAAR